MNHRKSIVLAFSVFFLLCLASAASGSVGVFQEKGGVDNPFNQFNSNGFYRASPALGDLTGDGKLEAVVGFWDSSYDGKIGFFTLNASNQYESHAAFSLFDTDGTTPITGFGNNIEVKPTLWDWDNNGSLDLFVATSAGTGNILYFQNNGSNGFVRNDSANPFGNVSDLGISKVTFGNFLNKGEQPEAIVGSSSGGENLKYFTLDSNRKFVLNSDENPINDIYDGFDNPNPIPFAFDSNNDSLVDLAIGRPGGNLRLYSMFEDENDNLKRKYSSDSKYFENLQAIRIGGSKGFFDIANCDPFAMHDEDHAGIHLFIGSNADGVLYFVEKVAVPGDYNDDGGVNIGDAILALKIVAGVPIPAGDTINLDNRISGEAIGIEEAIYALRKVAGF